MRLTFVMEILDDVHHSVDLIHSFGCYSGYDFTSREPARYAWQFL